MKFKSAVKQIVILLRLLPVNSNNYLNYLWQKYGPFVSDTAFQYQKVRLRIAKIRCDLSFLKTCKNENLLPTFVRFRLPAFHLRYKSSIFKCYRDILISEIKYKKRELSQLYRHSNRLKFDLSSNMVHIIYVRLSSIIDTLVEQRHHSWTSGHDKKLKNLRTQQHSLPVTQSFEYPRKPVLNLSKRQLTDEENDALENGLNFVFSPSKLDEETVIANIETFFVSLLGYATDRRDYEKKDKEERTQYKLTPDQLKFANKIRRCTDEFRSKSSSILKKLGVNSEKQLKLLKNLAKDKSIIITKADKGQSVVILDREEYLKKMESIINDDTTFNQIDEDPTIYEEDRLIRKLRQMKERGFISKDEYDYCYPSGSQPARLYGLPKIHKVEIPMRPILSASGTFNYRIARLLVRRLSHLKKHPTIIEDTFRFVDELHSLDIDMTTHKLISFDVTSLFTKVPLKETIEIILSELYKGECHCSYIDMEKKEKKKKKETCKVCLDRSDMKWLLETATSRTHFHFNGKIFSQINGVAMGSPVGPLLADIFLVHLEKKLMEQLEQFGMVYWRRYVDDSLAIIRNDADINKLKLVLNSFHPSIQFTSEPEVDQSIPFLDIFVRRSPYRIDQRQKTVSETGVNQQDYITCESLKVENDNNQQQENDQEQQIQSPKRSWFSTSIYRKPSYTGLILKWKSLVPLEYKRSAISSMAYRAIRISSDYFLLHKEFLFIRQIAVSNGYPLPFVLRVIRTTLEKHLNDKRTEKTHPNNIQQPKNDPKKQVVLIDIPYVGRTTSSLGKKLVNIAKQVEPSFHVQPIPRPFPKIQSFFARKDPITRQLLSNVVYNIPCASCSASYIGKTCRQVSRRFEEHGLMPRALIRPQKSNPAAQTTTSPEDVSGLRRSKRKKRDIDYALNEREIDLMVKESELAPKAKKSAIYDHTIETGHSMDWVNWKILCKDQKYYPLLVRESIQIAKLQPTLNKTICSVPLVVYPDVISIVKPKVKMK